MSISKEQVEHVAKLSRLSLTEKECASYTQELSSIIGYFVCLEELSTEGVEPSSQVTGLTNVLADDEVDRSLCLREELLSCTSLPVVEHQIRVNPVME